MEADWAVEIGPGLAVIEAEWRGYIDLRADPEKIAALPETERLPALAEALRELNRPGLFTSKCDVWALEAAELDADEFGAAAEACGAALAVYIDTVSAEAEIFASFERHEAWVREAAALLRSVEIGNGRVDLVVRAAEHRGASGFGVTVYAAGCGANADAAREAIAPILRAVTITMIEAAPSRARSSIG